MYFDFDYYKDKKVVVRCKSKTQAKKWCKLMHKNGLEWSNGKSCYNHIAYQYYKNQTCYTLDGYFYALKDCLWSDYTVIEFEDIVTGKYDRRNKMFTKKDLKNGDYVQCRNGVNYIYVEVHGTGYFVNNTGYNFVDSYDDNLTAPRVSELDIMEVRRMNICGINDAFNAIWDIDEDIVYQRQEQKLWNGMTYEEAHRKLWNALADGEVKDKREWFRINNKNKEQIPKDDCFACEVARCHSIKDFNNICRYCPLCEYKQDGPCLDGLYLKWTNAKGFEKFKLAHEIANLPWKEK